MHMNKETQQTKEDRIIENLDKGESVIAALLGVQADAVDAQMYETLTSMKDTTTPVPSRESFARMLNGVPLSESVASPYQSVRSPFMPVRFVVPALLGLLIIVSGIGIDTGRIRVDRDSILSPGSLSTQVATTTTDDTTAATTLQAARMMSASETDTSSASTLALAPEEDYDAYFEEESSAFMSIAEAYEVTI